MLEKYPVPELWREKGSISVGHSDCNCSEDCTALLKLKARGHASRLLTKRGGGSVK